MKNFMKMLGHELTACNSQFASWIFRKKLSDLIKTWKTMVFGPQVKYFLLMYSTLINNENRIWFHVETVHSQTWILGGTGFLLVFSIDLIIVWCFNWYYLKVCVLGTNIIARCIFCTSLRPWYKENKFSSSNLNHHLQKQHNTNATTKMHQHLGRVLFYNRFLSMQAGKLYHHYNFYWSLETAKLQMHWLMMSWFCLKSKIKRKYTILIYFKRYGSLVFSPINWYKRKPSLDMLNVIYWKCLTFPIQESCIEL